LKDTKTQELLLIWESWWGYRTHNLKKESQLHKSSGIEKLY